MLKLKPRKIYVRAIDITNGECARSELCAIALAIKNSFRSADSVGVDGGTYVSIYDKDKKLQTWVVPKKVITFIDKFDNSKTVHPFSFVIKPMKHKSN